jgi:hypothetical protein
MASWNLLDDKQEQELHKTRLLNVEEKPFKRLTKRIQTVTSLTKGKAVQQPTPPPENANGEQDGGTSQPPEKDVAAIQRQRDQLKEDLTLDFAAFDSSIARLQFLMQANARERERYEESKQRILHESEAVRSRNHLLRMQLEEARAELEQRKKYDELAEKITSNRMLRPREDQVANLRKLEEECQELARESEAYSETWTERRDQFNRIMEEGMVLRQQIRNEKEEAERREGMNEDGEEDGEASRGAPTPKQIASGNVTPHPESGTMSRTEGDAGTPFPGSRTPARDSQDGPESLKTQAGGLGTLSRPGSRAPSRDVSPHRRIEQDEVEDGEDVEMSDSLRPETVTDTQATNGGTPQITVDAPDNAGDSMEVDNV